MSEHPLLSSGQATHRPLCWCGGWGVGVGTRNLCNCPSFGPRFPGFLPAVVLRQHRHYQYSQLRVLHCLPICLLWTSCPSCAAWTDHLLAVCKQLHGGLRALRPDELASTLALSNHLLLHVVARRWADGGVSARGKRAGRGNQIGIARRTKPCMPWTLPCDGKRDWLAGLLQSHNVHLPLASIPPFIVFPFWFFRAPPHPPRCCSLRVVASGSTANLVWVSSQAAPCAAR